MSSTLNGDFLQLITIYIILHKYIRFLFWGGMRTTFESGTTMFIPCYKRSSCESEVPVLVTILSSTCL